MVTKIFLAMAIIIGGGLILQARGDAREEERRLKMETRDAASTFASLIVGSIEHSMLEGEGIKVQRLVDDLKMRVRKAAMSGTDTAANDMRSADIRIYDQRGIEVFAPKPTGEPKNVPKEVAKLLSAAAGAGAVAIYRNTSGRFMQTIANERRCIKCHAPEAGKPVDKYRGVIDLRIVGDVCAKRRTEVLTKLVTAGFYHIMAARQAKTLPSYFTELTGAAKGVVATVFNASAEARYGDDIPGVSEEMIEQVIKNPAGTKTVDTPTGPVSLVPLMMEQRCTSCHDKKSDVIGKPRGVLAVSLQGLSASNQCSEKTLLGVVDTSLRYIMLSALGRRVADFLDDAVKTGAMSQIVLYDNKGRTYWNTTHPQPPGHIAPVLRSKDSSFEFLGSGEKEMVRVVRPLMNKVGCKRCHDMSSKLRGVVSVSLSTAKAARARQESMEHRTKYTGLTLLGILIILGGFLQYFVVRPVNRIGDVADEVGRGNLAVSVSHARADGDEVARLGARINEMVRGLRTKTQLEKFVSKGTVEAASGADHGGVERSGELRPMTILFSDIRGFTAFSEKREPGEVVSMLNTLLKLQADSVVKHGGDIDKFVGDELMAVFSDEDAELRAVRCAVDLIKRVEEESLHGLTVGVGISSGDVIYGAIGHEDRMDFTVIGDVVNTGARLCSVAAGGQLIVTTDVRAACADVDDLEFEQGEPLSLKGKREPLENFRVRGKA